MPAEANGDRRDYELLWSLITPDADVARLWYVILQIGEKCFTNTLRVTSEQVGKSQIKGSKWAIGERLLHLELRPVQP